ncbi:MAG: ROK family protein [Lachnospiraceae bacterium]|nr:ROK family protein [Lachnospiraceae bacterium]
MIDGSNLSKAKTLNQSAIRKIIYHSGPVSRQYIASQLSLTLPTITTNVSRLISLGLLKEVPNTSTSEPSIGRKAQLVDIEENSRLFLGIEMRTILRRAVITTYRGHILYQISDDTPHTSYEDCIASTCQLIQRLLLSSGLSKEDISGIGICLPGIVDTENGILSKYGRHNWTDKPVREDFAKQLNYQGPISVENNSCARAYGIYMFHKDISQQTNRFAYFMIASGIACPIMNSGIQDTHPVLASGEIGHMVMVPGGLPCHCGNRGCLEAYSSEDAMIARCQELLDTGNAPYLEKLCQNEPLSMKHILAAQNYGEASVCKIVDDAIFYLGIAIANIENFIRTQSFIVDCVLFYNPQNSQNLSETIKQNLYTKTLPEAKFIFRVPDEFSGAIGAAAVAVNHDLQTFIE